MRIIITGASGFVGQNLALYLKKRQYDVSSVSLRDANWKRAFLTDAVAIVHLVGKAHDTSNSVKQDEYFKINRDITIEVFNEFIKSNTRDFFYFSSVKAAADSVSGVLKESVTEAPLTSYGRSKLEAEKFLLAQKIPEGKRLFIIRPCMIHGPGNKGNLNLLYNIAKRGIPWPLASFDNKRSFLSIDNLSFLLEAMIQNTYLLPGVYNFSDDEPVSTNEIVMLIGDIVGKKTRLINVPRGLIRFVAKLGDLLPLSLNSERLKKLTESYVVSNEKIKSELNINKLPETTIRGLEKTIRTFQNSK